MLIISRRRGQRIMVGGGLEIVVTELSRSTVKLGIRAPAELPVLRGEVWETIARANEEALKSSLGDPTLELHPGRSSEEARLPARLGGVRVVEVVR
jgi:carbon storage regulator